MEVKRTVRSSGIFTDKNNSQWFFTRYNQFFWSSSFLKINDENHVLAKSSMDAETSIKAGFAVV